MDKKIKKLWIKALTNGRRKQCKGALHRDGGFCCLGVLCDLHRIHKLRKPARGTWKNNGLGKMMYGGTCETLVLPLEVKQWAGLRSNDPRLRGRKNASSLNDGEPFQTNPLRSHTFKEIAKLIKKKL